MKAVAILVLSVSVLFHWTHGSWCAKKFQVFPGHTACLETSSEATPKPPNDVEKEAITKDHNNRRAGVDPPAVNMMELSWDDEVAMLAQKWVNTCPTSGDGLRHDSSSDRHIPGRFTVGQNMARGQSTFDEAIEHWYSEVHDYQYATTIDNHKMHNLMVEHYTQLVWALSVKVGCGRALCDGEHIYACNYAPSGNIGNFNYPYMYSRRRLGCKNYFNGLCVCGGLVCLNGRDLDPKTCTCDCGKQFIAPACHLNCGLAELDSQCGSNGLYQVETCKNNFLSQANCPKMCGVCPYAGKGYVDEKPKEPKKEDDKQTQGSENTKVGPKGNTISKTSTGDKLPATNINTRADAGKKYVPAVATNGEVVEESDSSNGTDTNKTGMANQNGGGEVTLHVGLSFFLATLLLAACCSMF